MAVSPSSPATRYEYNVDYAPNEAIKAMRHCWLPVNYNYKSLAWDSRELVNGDDYDCYNDTHECVWGSLNSHLQSSTQVVRRWQWQPHVICTMQIELNAASLFLYEAMKRPFIAVWRLYQPLLKYSMVCKADAA